jgi:hypothetical protein
MNQTETCKRCQHHKFDPKQGIICGLTAKKPEFEYTCPSFEQIPGMSEKTLNPLRHNDKRARLAITLILVVLLMDIFTIFASSLQLNLLHDANKGEMITTDEVSINSLRMLVSAILYSIAFIVSAVTFILWFRRAYYNLAQRRSLRFSDGWAAGSWFVPFINLGRPLVMMREMYNECKSMLNKADKTLRQPRNANLPIVWWVLWLGVNVLSNFNSRLTEGADTVPELINSTIFDIVVAAAGIILALITVRVIKNYNEAEKLMIEKDKEMRMSRLKAKTSLQPSSSMV